MEIEVINRGSEVASVGAPHAPSAVQANQYPSDGWELYLNALEGASPALAAIGITDYCITRSYELVKAQKDIRKLVCDNPEGGELAFRDRARRLRIALDR
jgi:hypothetical protein